MTINIAFDQTIDFACLLPNIYTSDFPTTVKQLAESSPISVLKLTNFVLHLE